MGAGDTSSGKYLHLNSSITKLSKNNYRVTVTLGTSSSGVYNAYGVRVYTYIAGTRYLLGVPTISGGTPTQTTFTKDFTITKNTGVYAYCICSYCEDGLHNEYYSNFVNQTSSDTATYENTNPPTKPNASINSVSNNSYVNESIDGTTRTVYAGNNTLQLYTGKPGDATSLTLNLQYYNGSSWYNYSGFPTSSLNASNQIIVNNTFGDGDRYNSGKKLFKLWATAKNDGGSTDSDAVYFCFNDIPTLDSNGLSINTKSTSNGITLTIPAHSDTAAKQTKYYVTVENTSNWASSGFETTSRSVSFNVSDYGVSAGNSFQIKVTPIDLLEWGSAYTNAGLQNLLRNSPPAAPSNVGPSSGYYNDSIPVTWSAGSDNETGSGSLKYEIQVSKDGGYNYYTTTTVTGTTSHSYGISNDGGGTSYIFRIKTIDGHGESSGWAYSGTSYKNNPPNAPGSIGPSSGYYNDSISVTWSAGSDNETGSGSLRYELQVSKNSGNYDTITTTTGVTSHSYGISSDGGGTSYKFRVRTIDGHGIGSGWTYSGTSYKNNPPNAPGSISVPLYGETTFSVTWAAGSDNETSSGNLRYEIQVSKNGSSSYDSVTTVTGITYYTYNISSGDARGTSYKFRIKTIDDLNTSSTWTYSGLSYRNYAPNPVTNVVSNKYGETIIPVTWAAGSDNETSSQNLRYDIQVSKDNGSSYNGLATITGTTSYNYNIPSGDVRGGSYKFRIQTIDEFGIGSTFAYSNLSYKNQIPSDPTNIQPGADYYELKIPLTWTASTDVETPQSALRYQVRLSKNSNSWEDLVTVTSASQTILYNYNISESDPEGTSYRFAIKAIDEFDIASNWSYSATYLKNYRPIAPSSMIISQVYHESVIPINWLAGSDTNDGSENLIYKLEVSKNDGTFAEIFSSTKNITNYNYSIINDIRGTKYTFRVRAIDPLNASSGYRDSIVVYRNILPITPTIIYPVSSGSIYDTSPRIAIEVKTAWSGLGQTISVYWNGVWYNSSTNASMFSTSGSNFKNGNRIIFQTPNLVIANDVTPVTIKIKSHDGVSTSLEGSTSFKILTNPLPNIAKGETMITTNVVITMRNVANNLRRAYGLTDYEFTDGSLNSGEYFDDLYIDQLQSTIDSIRSILNNWDSTPTDNVVTIWTIVDDGNIITSSVIKELYDALLDI